MQNWVATCISHTPAPEITVTVAPFRAWRGSRLIVARGPMQATIEAGDYHGFGDGFQPAGPQSGKY